MKIAAFRAIAQESPAMQAEIMGAAKSRKAGWTTAEAIKSAKARVTPVTERAGEIDAATFALNGLRQARSNITAAIGGAPYSGADAASMNQIMRSIKEMIEDYLQGDGA